MISSNYDGSIMEYPSHVGDDVNAKVLYAETRASLWLTEAGLQRKIKEEGLYNNKET
jgi:hypothetical protein